ncbi:mitochondrial import inner membrane translocase subunit Tim10B [Glossina fuscipes]|uniref:Mitochondrial import inner membrane translocase subunit n=2 Tax=Nemorhina TaxID=44051 RepID=A0A9C5Z9R5_9MUSC|nr:mitochondrial import inner membrane translocase subunit Tim10B [Glossina fuscipes]
MDPNLRNLKDFLTLYNRITELCFDRCVDNFNGRVLSNTENICVNHCVNKFARFNQAMMKVYVEVQTQLNQKRLKELEEQQKLLDQQSLQLPISTTQISAPLSTDQKITENLQA